MEVLLGPVQEEYQPIKHIKCIFQPNDSMILVPNCILLFLISPFLPQTRISFRPLLLLVTYKFSCGETVGVAHKQQKILSNIEKKKEKKLLEISAQKIR